MTQPTPDLVADMVATAIRAHDERRPRSIQKAEGRLGPSDLGWCRQEALLTLSEVPQSDSDDTWAAFCGTAIGDAVEMALKELFPTWLIGSIDKQRVTRTYKGQYGDYEISGQPDILVPEWNACLDLKSKDGFGWVKREPWSQSYRYQTHTYVTGAAEAGILDNTKPMYVGLVYIDRSGKIGQPYVVLEEYDPTLDDPITAWIDDVIYARLHKEDAPRDIPAPVCEQICGHFSVCRGALPSTEMDLIVNTELSRAMELYRDAIDMEKEAKELKVGASAILKGVNGTDGINQVRWTHVPGSRVPGYERQAYDRIDVRRARSRG